MGVARLLARMGVAIYLTADTICGVRQSELQGTPQVRTDISRSENPNVRLVQ